MTIRNWFSAIAFSAAATASLGAPPGRIEIAYDLVRNGSPVAEIVARLEHDGKSYRITETWKGRGLLALRGDIRRSSRGKVGIAGLQPIEFTDERTGREPGRVSFDWSAKKATLQHKGASRVDPLPPNPHDRLSVLFQSAFATPPGQAIKGNVTDGREFSEQAYQLAGAERLKTPAGEFDTVKLARKHAGGDARSTEIWLARDRGFVPVRILVVDTGEGSRLDQVAARLSTP